MEGADWGQFVTQVGFPAALALILMRWAAQRIEKTEGAAADREKLMGARISALEDRIENQLIGMVKEQGELIIATKSAMLEMASSVRSVACLEHRAVHLRGQQQQAGGTGQPAP